MAEKILMSALSPTMEDGTIAGWSKSEGDKVAAGDVICEVETDKATMDYESTQEGTLLKIIRGEGDTAKVGEIIAIIGEEGEDISDLEAEASGEQSEGDAGSGGEPESGGADKAESGTGSSGAAESDSGDVQPAAASKSESPAAGAASSSAGAQAGARTGGAAARGESGIVKASPLARKIASDRGIDIAQVPGSGPAGRVVKADVESFEPAAAGAQGAAAASVATAMPGEDRSIPVNRMRATIAKRLGESKFGAPHFYLKLSVDMRGILAARSRLNSELTEKVSLNAFMMKFSAEALKRHPNVNSSWQGDHIIEYGSIDIGLAVEMKAGGLITPVVRNCGNRGIVDIDAELKELITKAREGGLQPEEFSGATFSISNLGNFGIEEFTAIINPPGSAILALGNTQKTPVFDENNIMSVVPQMKMTLSCDHRVVDGAAGARFLHDLQKMMEDPARALF